MEGITTEQIIQIAVFSGIMLITLLGGWLFRRLYRRFIIKSTLIVQNDPTYYKFTGHVIAAFIYLLGFSFAVLSVPSLRAVSTSIIAGAGILAVAVGFASQAAISNIISGFFIIIFKPFRVNDLLEIHGGLAGTVEDITLRHTVMKDYNNRRIIIPNSIISNEVLINSHLFDDKVCKFIHIGISYDSDLLKAKNIIREEILAHPLNIDPRNEEQIAEGKELAPVRVMSHGDSSINLRGWAWAKDTADGFILKCDLLESIKLRFDREGIEIPFPYRTIVYKNPNLSDHGNQ